MVADGAGAGAEQVKSSLLNYLETKNMKNREIKPISKAIRDGRYILIIVCLKVINIQAFNIWKGTGIL